MRFRLLALHHGVFFPAVLFSKCPLLPLSCQRSAGSCQRHYNPCPWVRGISPSAGCRHGSAPGKALMSSRGKFQPHLRPKLRDGAHREADLRSLATSNTDLNSAWTSSTLQTNRDVPLDTFNLINPGAVCVFLFNRRGAGNPAAAAVTRRSRQGSCIQIQLRSTCLLLLPPEQQNHSKINYP